RTRLQRGERSEGDHRFPAAAGEADHAVSARIEENLHRLALVFAEREDFVAKDHVEKFASRDARAIVDRPAELQHALLHFAAMQKAEPPTPRPARHRML